MLDVDYLMQCARDAENSITRLATPTPMLAWTNTPHVSDTVYTATTFGFNGARTHTHTGRTAEFAESASTNCFDATNHTTHAESSIFIV